MAMLIMALEGDGCEDRGQGGAEGAGGPTRGTEEGAANFLPHGRGAVSRPGFRLCRATVPRPRDYQWPVLLNPLIRAHPQKDAIAHLVISSLDIFSLESKMVQFWARLNKKM